MIFFKNKLFLFVIAIFIFFAGFQIVEAQCFKYCEGSNCTYTTSKPNSSKSVTSLESVSEAMCANNYSSDSLVSCGDGLLEDIPAMIPKTIHIIYLLIQIAIPILLVVFGLIDFIKAIISSKEEEIKKGQQIFIKRLIAGILVFFVFAIVKLVISFAGDDNKTKILNCASCLINNNSDCVGG